MRTRRVALDPEGFRLIAAGASPPRGMLEIETLRIDYMPTVHEARAKSDPLG